MTILITLLILFIVSTALLGWFCFKLVFRLNFVSNNLVELYGRLSEFDQHIKFIYELEMYYGDETLKNLIRHSRDLRNYMTKYKEVMELLEEQEEIIEEDIDDEDDQSPENNEEKEKFASTTGKTVFYSGT
jgi:thioredoxin-related protein